MSPSGPVPPDMRILTLYRLSQMVLDKKLHGVLDQQRGILLIYPESVADVSIWEFNDPSDADLGLQNTYGSAIDTLEQVGKVVDSLYAKVC